ncbi:metallopeptidase family protein [Solicola gregarius]|uniref:Metallopeptidase family protein n=1 Tax=Solicola gregarius TaxID=2908642 RepID=A0AA46TF74_9ACTN|nr:metallopeptidase family protein [Solicola gregarius]UYM04040.1 metallopeptidase family protein [Solicola gregarius]
MRPKATHAPARSGRRRDRRGRGTRGPLALPGPLAPDGVPAQRSPAEEFDDLVLAVVDRLRTRFPERVDAVEFAVEDHPLLPEEWVRHVPYASSVPEGPDTRARVVVFRRPLLTHSEDATDLADLLLDTLIEELAVLWGVDPDDLDPPR